MFPTRGQARGRKGSSAEELQVILQSLGLESHVGILASEGVLTDHDLFDLKNLSDLPTTLPLNVRQQLVAYALSRADASEGSDDAHHHAAGDSDELQGILFWGVEGTGTW